VTTFYLTVIHRPEMVPEYLQKEAQKGKARTSGAAPSSANRWTSSAPSSASPRERHPDDDPDDLREPLQRGGRGDRQRGSRRYGDEIGSTFLGLQCAQFREKFASKELAIWLFSMEDKRRIVDEVFGKFEDVFGFLPTSTGSYYMDAELVNYIKERYPMVKVAVATCWEEGPKAYHNANNSWYTLLDGGP